MAARSLDRLLATGLVRQGSPAQVPRAPRAWELAALAGRLVEVVGHGRGALLTAAAELVHQAQLAREPVAWIGDRAATFFPPDLAACGVDLGALAVVHGDDARARLAAADRLLRSGAFGLLVLDLAGARAIDVPLAVQVRLANLAQAHAAVLLCLGDEPQWQVASLRAESACRRLGEGRFASVLAVHKDKRGGGGWEHEQGCRGPLGLR
jgi:recombination protein RecA